MISDYKQEYERWLDNVSEPELSEELLDMDPAAAEDAFYRDLEFGTGGLRGVIGAGTNRMNVYVVAKASQGLADYLNKTAGASPLVVIGYDTRIKSDVFSRVAASVFAARAAAGADGVIRRESAVGIRRGDDHGEPQPDEIQRLQGLRP